MFPCVLNQIIKLHTHTHTHYILRFFFIKDRIDQGATGETPNLAFSTGVINSNNNQSNQTSWFAWDWGVTQNPGFLLLKLRQSWANQDIKHLLTFLPIHSVAPIKLGIRVTFSVMVSLGQWIKKPWLRALNIYGLVSISPNFSVPKFA